MSQVFDRLLCASANGQRAPIDADDVRALLDLYERTPGEHPKPQGPFHLNEYLTNRRKAGGGTTPAPSSRATARTRPWTRRRRPATRRHPGSPAGGRGFTTRPRCSAPGAHELKPHLVRTFKLSNDKHFVEKLRDVIGLYLNPPEHALLFCVDEKSQIQALDRSQPGLPMKKGRAGTMTHDYKRHGTTTLFAALNVLEGTVFGKCYPRHRHTEYLRFLREIDRRTPKELDIHLIVDNYSAHKHHRVKCWFERHPRFHAHFIPTSSSWLNLVERFFREIADRRIRRGIFRSVRELTQAIYDFLQHYNENPRPFLWTKSADHILTKLAPLYANRG